MLALRSIVNQIIYVFRINKCGKGRAGRSLCERSWAPGPCILGPWRAPAAQNAVSIGIIPMLAQGMSAGTGRAGCRDGCHGVVCTAAKSWDHQPFLITAISSRACVSNFGSFIHAINKEAEDMLLRQAAESPHAASASPATCAHEIVHSRERNALAVNTNTRQFLVQADCQAAAETRPASACHIYEQHQH